MDGYAWSVTTIACVDMNTSCHPFPVENCIITWCHRTIVVADKHHKDTQLNQTDITLQQKGRTPNNCNEFNKSKLNKYLV